MVKGTFFDEIDTMLLKLYYLYKKSSKRTRELEAFGEIYDKVITKPCKSSGTLWVAHKVNAMEIVLQNYGIFMTHLESLSQNDSQALKRAELEGFFKHWLQAKYPLNLAIYLYILQPVKVLSLAMQQELHDPAVQVEHINEFGWSMLKLNALHTESIRGRGRSISGGHIFIYSCYAQLISFEIEIKILKSIVFTVCEQEYMNICPPPPPPPLIDLPQPLESIDKNTSRLTNYTKFLKEVTCVEGFYKYREIKLLNFDASSEKIKKSYSDVISCLTAKMNERFEDLRTHPVEYNERVQRKIRCLKRDSNSFETMNFVVLCNVRIICIN